MSSSWVSLPQFHKPPTSSSFRVEILLAYFLMKCINRHYLFLLADTKVYEEGSLRSPHFWALESFWQDFLSCEKRSFLFRFLNVSNFPAFCFWVKSKGNKLKSVRFQNKILDSQTTKLFRMQSQKRFNFQRGGKMSPVFVLVFVLTQHSREHLNNYETD